MINSNTLKALFLFIFILLGKHISQLLACSITNLIKEHFIVKHFIGFFVLVVSEISARYITKSSVQITFLSLPIIMFLLGYLYLLFKLKTKL